jgi:hypothetical protein
VRRCTLPLLLLLAGALAAQQSSVSQTTSVNINGERVDDGPAFAQTQSDGNKTITQTHQSINGQTVPMQRIEERVIKDDATGKIVERTIQGYDPDGNPSLPVKEVIDQRKHADGSSTTQTTRSRGDINGDMQVIEQSTTETHPTSSGETSETVVERQTAEGLAPVEKRDAVVAKQAGGQQTDTEIYRQDGSGFQLAARTTDQHTEQNGKTSDNTAEYEIGPTGSLQLQSQTVTSTVTRADGSKDSTVEIYGRSVPGTVTSADSPLKLQEQQSIQTVSGPGNSTVQTLNVRRPSVSNPETLGPEQQISQTVCTGDCNPKK